MKIRNASGLVALLVLVGCGAVKVTLLNPDLGAGARPRGCAIEFLNQAPERAYDELAELESHVTSVPPGGAQEVLRDTSCQLGADAVIVTRNFVTNAYGHVLVVGTAIRYRPDLPAPPPPEPPSEPAPGTVTL
jgi:hypothetical protein